MYHSKRIGLIIFFLIAIIIVMAPSGNKLSCAGEGKGIISLELATSYKQAKAIRDEWGQKCATTACLECDQPRIHYAIVNTWLDYLFIIIYGFFLLALNGRYNYQNAARPKRYNIVSWMIVATCCLDIVENVGMIGFLTSTRDWFPVAIFFIPSMLKWLLLVIIFVWGLPTILLAVTEIFKDIFRIFLMLPLALISLFVLFFIIWQSDQGQDLLLTINANDFGPLTLYIALVCLAFMNWHFPKFFYNADFNTVRFREFFTRDFTYTDQSEQNIIAIPRIFGILTFLIPAFGILQVFKIFKVDFMMSCSSPFLLLFITTLVFHVCYRQMIFQRFRERYPRIFIAACIALALLPLAFWPLNNSDPSDLKWLFFGFLAYAVLFSLLTANRNFIKDMWLFRFFSDKNITPVMWGLAAIPAAAFLFFAAMNLFCASFSDVKYLSLAIVICGIIFYYALFTILNLLGKMYKTSYSMILLVVMLVISANVKNDYHFVKQVAPADTTIKTLSLKEYAVEWLHQRAASHPGDSVYRIYLVNTYGGGIRASAWTCLAMNRLDSLSLLYHNELFQDHVFSYSGASGGTVGASILCANRYHHLDSVKTNDYTGFFGNDFLTPVLVGALGNDVWAGGFGVKADDRSVVQEHLWAKNYQRHFGKAYNLPFDDLWKDRTTYRVPLLFSNTTDYKEGRKGIYAPVKLDPVDFPGATIVRGLLPGSNSLYLGTGAFLSARFPYISPAAGIRKTSQSTTKDYHFLDGGMVENSGAETSLHIYNVLRRVSDSIGIANGKKMEIYVISLKNTFPKDDSVLKEKSKNLSQLTAPIAGAVSVGLVGNTNKSEQINERYFASRYFRIYPVTNKAHTDGKKNKIEVPLPLGWSISDKALESMNNSLNILSAEGNKLNNLARGLK